MIRILDIREQTHSALQIPISNFPEYYLCEREGPSTLHVGRNSKPQDPISKWSKKGIPPPSSLFGEFPMFPCTVNGDYGDLIVSQSLDFIFRSSS